MTLNPMTAEESAALTAALMATPLQVTYHSFQLGHDVTEEMQITSMPRRFALKNGSGTRWLHEDVLSFQQN